MERDIECLVEVLVRLEVVPVREPGNEDEMTRRGDGEELGEPLRDPEHERLPVGQRSGPVADAQNREHDCQSQQDARGEVETGAAHAAIVCAAP
jgi:hypothetical protein